MKAIKDSAIYLAGELISKSVPFLLLPYLSRKLGVEGFGELSYYQIYLSVFAIFIGLNQDGAIVRYFYFYGKRSISLIIRSSYLYTVSVSLLFIIIFIFFKSEIFIYIILACMMQSLISVQLALRQCKKKSLSYIMIQVSSSMLVAFFTVLLLEIYQQDLVEKRILALLVSNALLMFFLILFSKEKNKKFSFQTYKESILYLLAFGVPLILHNLGGVLKGHLDRLFIYQYFSAYDLGLYAMGATLASVVSILLMALNKALNPYYFELLKNNKITISNIYRYVLYSLSIVPFFVLMILLLPENLFIWVLGEKFLGVKYFFVVFASANIMNMTYILLANYLYYYGETKKIALCSMLSMIVYILSILLLTPFGIEYIPFASIIGIIAIIPLLVWMTYKTSLSVK